MLDKAEDVAHAGFGSHISMEDLTLEKAIGRFRTTVITRALYGKQESLQIWTVLARGIFVSRLYLIASCLQEMRKSEVQHLPVK